MDNSSHNESLGTGHLKFTDLKFTGTMKSNAESQSRDSEDETQEPMDPNQSIVVSTLAQPEDQDSEDEIDGATVLLFEETLTKHLASKTEGGKMKLKWNGSLIDFKDFISLILDAKGKWESRSQDNYEIHTFKEAKSKFRLTWWASSKTFLVQGNQSSKIMKKIESLLQVPANATKVSAHSTEENLPESSPKSKKRKKNKGNPKVNDEEQKKVENEINKIWEAIENLKKTLTERPVVNASNSEEIPGVSVANRYAVLTSSRNFPNQHEVELKDPPTTLDKDKEISRLKSILFDHERKINGLENKLSKSEKTIQDLQAENVSLKRDKTGLQQKLNESQKINGQDRRKSDSNTKEPAMDNTGKMPKNSTTQNATSKPMKPRILVAGDSMVRDLKGWLMSRNKSVKVHSFSGATTEDMESYLIPLINKKPDHILLHVGTNNLATDTPEVIVEKLLRLVNMITSKGIQCSVSELIIRDDTLWHKGIKVNQLLNNKVTEGMNIVRNENITVNHLNRSKLHLNRRGVGALAHNIIKFIKDLKFNNLHI